MDMSEKIRIYLDNDIASSISRRDLEVMELAAVDQLLDANRHSHVSVEVSRQSWREMERAPAKYHEGLKSGIKGLSVLRDDHTVLGSHTNVDQFGGCVCNPIVTDIVNDQLFADLCAAGLKCDDAKQLMYAAHNGCQFFITCDGGILARRNKIEVLWAAIQVCRPSECVEQLTKQCLVGNGVVG